MDENTQPETSQVKKKRIIKLPDRLNSFANVDLYGTIKPLAENIKTVFQMVIGLSIVAVISIKLILFLFNPIPFSLLATQTLEFIGAALVVSTGFELAYTLFTDGPDEAVEPLITGLAAVILVVISPITTITSDVAGGVSLLVLALILLFILRYLFIKGHGLKSIYYGNNADENQST